MKRLSTFAATAMFGLAFLLPLTANAAFISYLSPTGMTNVPPGAMGAGDSSTLGNQGLTNGGFTDDYGFQNTTASAGSASAVNVKLSGNGLSSVQLELWSSIDSPNYQLVNTKLFGPSASLNVGSIVATSLDFSNLQSTAHYILRVIGVVSVSGSNTASYGGQLQLVPLPAAAWLFGSAFLGLCWLGRRSATRGVGMLPTG